MPFACLSGRTTPRKSKSGSRAAALQTITCLLVYSENRIRQGKFRATLDGAEQLRHYRFVETRCAQCGAAMTCQPEGGCWCAELPHVQVPAGAKACLCSNCLRAKIEALRNPDKQKEA